MISPVPLLPLLPVQSNVVPAISAIGVAMNSSSRQIVPASGVPIGVGCTVSTISNGFPGHD